MGIFWKKKKEKKVAGDLYPVGDFPPEYRIREVKFDDGRIEYFAEVKYSENEKFGITWQGIGSHQIMFNKGFNTIDEAQSAVEKRKMRDKNPSGIIEEKIHNI
jgi:hypothetical protein